MSQYRHHCIDHKLNQFTITVIDNGKKFSKISHAKYLYFSTNLEFCCNFGRVFECAIQGKKYCGVLWPPPLCAATYVSQLTFLAVIHVGDGNLTLRNVVVIIDVV